MKVYLVYLPCHSKYSYDGYEHQVDSVFLNEDKAKEYVAKFNLKIKDKHGQAYVEKIETKD